MGNRSSPGGERSEGEVSGRDHPALPGGPITSQRQSSDGDHTDRGNTFAVGCGQAWGIDLPRAVRDGVRTAPMLAVMTSAIATIAMMLSLCPRMRKPAAVAIAGARLIRIEKVAGGSRRSATNSSAYGIVEESSATAAPSSRMFG